MGTEERSSAAVHLVDVADIEEDRLESAGTGLDENTIVNVTFVAKDFLFEKMEAGIAAFQPVGLLDQTIRRIRTLNDHHVVQPVFIFDNSDTSKNVQSALVLAEVTTDDLPVGHVGSFFTQTKVRKSRRRFLYHFSLDRNVKEVMNQFISN